MSDRTNEDRDRDIKLLRDQVARLISKNLDLQRQLDDLQRSKTDAPVESLAASVVKSIQAAEDALAEEAVDGRRFIISDLEATFRGVILPQEDHLALRLPLPEYGVLPGHLGSVLISFTHVPPPVAPPPVDTGAPPPAPPQPGPEEGISGGLKGIRGRLFTLLERSQAGLITWKGGPGEDVRPRAVDQLTRLLADRERWEGAGFLQDLQALAESMSSHANTVARGRSSEAARAYRTAAASLVKTIRPLAKAGSASPGELESIAQALEQVVGLQERVRSTG